ncbi:MAG: cyclic nucleotide-binding/CBS domain-containing protein [Betaproteobacteria bacterium]|nr:MAG: cyclic nucleotide-binding/CBS domain-containing protein [Betaproteobacteria bacterium]
MEIELIEIREFLAAHHPFDALPADVLDRLPKKLTVRYLRRGTSVPPADAGSRDLYIVRQGAVETRDQRGELIDKLGEGDVLTAACTRSRDDAAMTSVTVEDTLVYLLPCEQLDGLRSAYPDFARHFDATLTERLEKAIEVLQQMPQRGSGLLTVAVGSLVKRPAVFVGPQASIREAAQRMSNERVSSLLVMQGDELLGMVTDRDLRNRCIAADVAISRPVTEIMTTQVYTISSELAGFEALMQMTRLNVHHLPVVDGRRVAGMVSTTDLIRHESANAVYLAGDVSKADSVEVLVEISRQLPEMQIQLALAGASARHVGDAVSTVNDAITQRLLRLAEAQLGAPPVAYAWVTGGSHARREQTSHSDQDNALIISDDFTTEHESYFESLARFVNDGLNACGFVYCPGDVMASNSQWRQPRAAWRRYFDTWINEPEPMALMLSSVFFDLRVVHGDASLLESLQQENLEKTRANGIFLAYMVANALTHRPPLGFFRNIVLIHGGEHDKTFDIKLRGVVPVVDLARVYSLAEGLEEVNTLDRLRAAAGTKALSAEGARNLEDAYDFIATLRVQHQARQLRAGEKADNFIASSEISGLERRHLKDAFRMIATMQQAIEQRYQSSRLR